VHSDSEPAARYTQQTVFYFDEFLTVKKGEEVAGVLQIRPNLRNNVRKGDFSFLWRSVMCVLKKMI